MPELIEDGERKLIVAGPARLAFQWTGDRWAHSLEYRESAEGVAQVLAVSVEADPERDHPARIVSPTYQDLQFQTHGDGLQALLVGQAGPHHFSAVFDVTGNGSDFWIKVDIADRCRGPVEVLASTYTVEARPDSLTDASPFAAQWRSGQVQVTFGATEPAKVSVAEHGHRRMQLQAFATSDQSNATRRLKYLWYCHTDTGLAPAAV